MRAQKTEMKRSVFLLLLSLLLGGCLSKPNSKREQVEAIWPKSDDAPLAVGDCVVLEQKHRALTSQPWVQKIDARGYYTAPFGLEVKIVGKTLLEAKDLVASEYARRNHLHRPRGLVLRRCEPNEWEMLNSNWDTTQFRLVCGPAA